MIKRSLLLVCIVLFSIWQILYGWSLHKGEVKAQEADQNLTISLLKIPGVEEPDMPERKPFTSIGVVFPDPDRNKLPDNTPLIERPGICYGCHNRKSIYAQSIATLDSDKYYHHPMGIFARKGNSPRALGANTAEGHYPGTGTWDLNGQLNCLSCHTYHECNEYCEENDNNNFLRWNFKNDSPDFCITCHHDKNAALLGEFKTGHNQQKQTPFTNRVVFNNGWRVVESKNCMFCHYIHDGKREGERFDYNWSSYGYDMENLAASHKPGDYIPPELDALMRVSAKVLPGEWADDISIRPDDSMPTNYEDMCYGCHGRESLVCGSGQAGSLLRPDIYFSHRYAVKPGDENPKSNMTSEGTLFPVSDGEASKVVNDYGVEADYMYCGSCHNVHNAAIKPYLHGNPERHRPYKAYPAEAEGFCQGCHLGDHPYNGDWMQSTHPIYKGPSTKTEDPLYKDSKYRNGGSGEKGAVFDNMDSSGTGKILCLSCHNVHGAMTNWDGTKAKNNFDNPTVDHKSSGGHGMLLVIDNNIDDGQRSDMCIQCHSQGLDNPHIFPSEKGDCAVCHIPHNAKGDKIWARDLPDLTGFGGVRQLCYSCHDGNYTLKGLIDYYELYGLPGAGNVFRRDKGADHVMHGGAWIEAGPYPKADSLRDEEGSYKNIDTLWFPLDPNDWDRVPNVQTGTAHNRSGLNYTKGGAGFYCGTCHNVHRNGGGAFLRYKNNDPVDDKCGNPAIQEFSIRKTFCSQCHGVPHAEDKDCMECHSPHRGAVNIEDDEALGRLILNVSPLSDTELYVDDDYSDVEDTDGDNEFRHIQAAINAAGRRIAIVIHPGTYMENIDFKGKAITMMSNDPSDPLVVAATIIDGNQVGSVVTFSNGEGSESVLSGVTVQNGQADKGGGIYCTSSSPTITNCIIKENSAVSYGGGIYCCDESSPTIKNCAIEDNSAASYGGGVYCYSSSAIIINCTITENSASSGGGGFRCYNSSPIITNCTISGNSAPTGGGIYNYSHSPETNSPTIKNCILWGNLVNEISGDTLIVTYSDLRGGYEGMENINDDPLFVDPDTGDYHLQSDSPCIDAGTDQNAPDSDKDGQSKPINTLFDMGAYEFQVFLIPFYQDSDGDSYGNPNIISFACDSPQGFVENADDCDDSDPNINPDAFEKCDFADNNCNGSIDEGLALYTFYADTDEDGYGNPDMMSIEACKEPPGYKPNHLDCNDDDPEVNPAKITIETTDNESLDDFTNGRNLLKTLQPSCSPYTSFDLLSDFKEMGDTLTFQYRKPQSRTFKPTYWFFGRVSGEEVDLSNNPSEEDADNLYIIDKRE